MNESDFEVLSDDSRVKPGCRTLQRNGSSLVLDSERGELVEACVSAKRKMAPAERNVDALKNHSEAERKRRARINAHLDTLRGLVPEAKKMDKAALLAEVINHLRKLKRNADEAMQQYVIPTYADEIKVEQEQGEVLDLELETMKASICCDYRPGLLSNLRQALVNLGLIVLSAEVATFEGRMKSIMVLTRCHEGDETLCQFLSNSLHLALCSIVNQFSTSEESPRPSVSNKRRRA
ncbi:transcription factor AIG1-like [Syzygium oleosum]|uniref:transcription factor AIG1-like n=1 Tax=Syzygium oleosum TaxID=219896 RepID=UPI0011D20D22|nr:transcription factor AIG1-like [Syzygium oleosum]